MVDFQQLGSELKQLLTLQVNPMGISFSKKRPHEIKFFEGSMPMPTEDGRTGKVAAGCVFWMHGTERTFTTIPEDHANCSVGSLTHGMKTLEEIQNNSDVTAILDCGWVELEVVPNIPVIKEKPNFVTYGPLNDISYIPDVVFLRVNGKQAMILKDAYPDIRLEGKPQCHVVSIAHEQKEIAISVGCMLSRVRTGMSNNEMTVAFPASRLEEIVAQLGNTCDINNTVAKYAAEDSKRFRSY